MRGEDKIEVLNHLARCSFAIGAEENKGRLRKANSDDGTEEDNQLGGNRRKNQEKLEVSSRGRSRKGVEETGDLHVSH